MLGVQTCCVIYRVSFGANISDSKAHITPAAGLTMPLTLWQPAWRSQGWGLGDAEIRSRCGCWAPASTLGGLDSGQVAIRW